MTAEQFTYWLQGYAELHGSPPSEQQWAVILDHLKLVVDKRTPDRPAIPPSYTPPPSWPTSGDAIPYVHEMMRSISPAPGTDQLRFKIKDGAHPLTGWPHEPSGGAQSPSPPKKAIC